MMFIFENLPTFIFALAFFVVFVLFLRGGLSLLLSGGDEQKTEKGRRRILISLYSLFILLLIAFVFFLVTYLVQKGEVLLPPGTPGEYPPSPAANLPPPPEFIEVDGYYFSGPWSLENNSYLRESAVYAILCKELEEYDIIYIGEAREKSQLLENREYRCWMEECNSDLGNLYLAVLWTPSDKYGSARRKNIKEEIEDQILPLCPLPENNN